MRTLVPLLLILLAALARGQEVRPLESAPGLKSALRQARKEGIGWPDLAEGDAGTVVRLFADRRNADAIVSSSAPLPRLLEACRRAAARAGFPEADFLTRQGKIVATVDVEFNDRLTVEGRTTRFVFPVRELVAELDRLPGGRPVVLLVESGPEARTVREAGRERTLPRFGDVLFDARATARVETVGLTCVAEWWGPLLGVAAGLALLALIVLPAVQVGGFVRRQLREPPPEATPTKTPEEVQAEYDAARAKARAVPVWRRAFPLLAFLPLALPLVTQTDVGQILGRQILYTLPGKPTLWILVALFAPVMLFLFWNLHVLRRHQRRAKNPAPDPLADVRPFLLACGAAVVWSTAMWLSVRTFRWPDPAIARALVLASLPVAFVFGALVSARRSARRVRELPPEDPLLGVAREIGGRAGVRVNRVMETDRDDEANAFATLFGTVGITRRLREELTPEETRAVIAHEIGHLRARDVRRTFLVSLGATALGWLGLWFVATRFATVPVAWLGMSQVVSLLLSLVLARALAPTRKRAEIAADRFAAEVAGPEATISALTKITDLNGGPRRLHPDDLRSAAHPDLEERIRRIREEFGGGT